ncbi:prolyl aminopeptidase [Stylosanthes scabra]|uniref:Prolyl aminopeptidase n=1 Tax=Stylosanthes scabra TaxID=79078 RepID=A0ABU6ZEI7_9FABA|nr:prolyl aminopeptidase [Stylosanthes scabra]
MSNIAYNITNGRSIPVKDNSAPVYITIGDGGNIEGSANNMTEPQPEYSAYREASFGHAIFDIKNRTHAYYSWNRMKMDMQLKLIPCGFSIDFGTHLMISLLMFHIKLGI